MKRANFYQHPKKGIFFSIIAVGLIVKGMASLKKRKVPEKGDSAWTNLFNSIA